jgi:hypothetical protein
MSKFYKSKTYKKGNIVLSVMIEIIRDKEYALIGEDLMLLSDYEKMLEKQGFSFIN